MLEKNLNYNIQYRNKSINSLVQQLNILGNRQVLIQPTKSFAIYNEQYKQIRRFQTKSIPHRQFFKFKQNDKKYFYNQILLDLNKKNLEQLVKNWQKCYNCTIIMQNNFKNIKKVIQKLQNKIQNNGMFCSIVNEKNQIFDLFGQSNITHRDLLQNKKFYQLANKQQIFKYFDSFNYINQNNEFINITFKNLDTCAQLNICILPRQIFRINCMSPYSLIKTQLLQIINYIKMNPNKRYEHISHLITKRHPITNFLTKILMSDTCNLILNWIQYQNQQSQIMAGKFQLFDKLSILGNLLRKADKHMIQIGAKSQIKEMIKHNNRQAFQKNTFQDNKIQNESKFMKTKAKNKQITKQQINLNQKAYDIRSKSQLQVQQQKQFQFCRSLQRKTHKYSLSPRHQDETNSLKFNKETNSYNISSHIIQGKTISKYDIVNQESRSNDDKNLMFQLNDTIMNKQNLQGINQSEKIALLKANHARQISQYHQTIQNLNKKIFILTKQRNLQELYKVHQRQIMLLQMKIKQLRNDIINLTKQEINDKQSKTIIRKLTQQLKQHQNNTLKKVSQGRILMLQRQIKQIKQKLSNSQKARNHLSLQVDALTKRLKIRDLQLQKINVDQLQKYKCQQLSITEQELFQDIKLLVKAVNNQQRNSVQFLLRKISLILSDMSKSRDIILQCNDFLVQLMQILDEKLSKKVPQIVLDCNKFIRAFLIDNLSIF